MFILGFNNQYDIDENGVVLSMPNISNSGIRALKPDIVKGYKLVRLSKNGIKTSIKIHRLVAMAFIPNPENKPQVNHKDGNKLNNHVSNLEWCTPQENSQHAVDMGLIITASGESNPLTKLLDIDIYWMKKHRFEYTTKELAKMFNVSIRTIFRALASDRDRSMV